MPPEPETQTPQPKPAEKRRITGKLVVDITVRHFDGAELLPLYDHLSEVRLYEEEDPLKAAKRALAEIVSAVKS